MSDKPIVSQILPLKPIRKPSIHPRPAGGYGETNKPT